MDLSKLLKLSTKDLREINGEIIKDFIICLKDNVSINSWFEDIDEEPESYSYSLKEANHFIYLLDQVH